MRKIKVLQFEGITKIVIENSPYYNPYPLWYVTTKEDYIKIRESLRELYVICGTTEQYKKTHPNSRGDIMICGRLLRHYIECLNTQNSIIQEYGED